MALFRQLPRELHGNIMQHMGRSTFFAVYPELMPRKLDSIDVDWAYYKLSRLFDFKYNYYHWLCEQNKPSIAYLEILKYDQWSTTNDKYSMMDFHLHHSPDLHMMCRFGDGYDPSPYMKTDHGWVLQVRVHAMLHLSVCLPSSVTMLWSSSYNQTRNSFRPFTCVSLNAQATACSENDC